MQNVHLRQACIAKKRPNNFIRLELYISQISGRGTAAEPTLRAYKDNYNRKWHKPYLG